MTSPITGTNHVEVWDEIPSQIIVNRYSEELGLDVARYFAPHDTIRIYKCLDSKYRFYHPFSSIGDAKFYDDFARVFPYYPSLRWDHKLASKYLDKGMKILEVGCGPGIFMQGLQSKGCHAVGLELNQEVAATANAQGLKVYNELIDEHVKSHLGAYDAVCFFHVLEHTADVKGFLDSAISTLKPGGLLVMSVPNNNPYLHRYDRLHTTNLPPHHMGLWDEPSLSNLPKFFGIELVNLSVDPLYEARKQAKVLFSHNNWHRAAQLVSKAPHIIDRLVSRTIGKFIDGRNLFAVFRKNTLPI